MWKKKSKIMLIGDFNKDTESTISMLNRIGIGLRRAPVRNSKGSRMNGAVMGRMIDHITYSGFPNNPTYAKNPNLFEENSNLKEKANEHCRADRRTNKIAEVKKARKFMLMNKPRELWSWLERYSGRFRSSLIDGPIFDKNRKLVTGYEEKSEAWAAHFEELAKDSTGNSRSAEKWSNMGLGSEAVYTECNAILTWADICAALKSTPNNKSPGYEGIPSESRSRQGSDLERNALPKQQLCTRSCAEGKSAGSVPGLGS
ncbi:hypothetical protein AYI70_g8913 [Smittium culicis]|uniref:Uncharacterized protein n=1 Tax=Smittium culicis TaxID=133412 RepID=A0A1R1XDR4_9FUNG|nr:hypothetical protein AYI70_g8913 [Smittium culicis]